MRQKKNKGYKKSHKIYALTVIVLGLAIILMALFLLFYVQKIEVKGNEYTDSQEIVDLVEEDPLAINSLYLLYKYRFTDYDMPGSLNSISVSLRAPWSVQVTVDEKSILGYVTSGEQNVYFDKEGTVVKESSEVLEGVPCIEGLDVSGAELYQSLENGDEAVFQSILEVTQQVREFELSPDRIVCSNGDIQLWFGEICVLLGDNITSDKMAQISPILANLEGRKGTLHLEHFSEEGNAVTFDIDELPAAEATQETPEAEQPEAASGE
ncbi:cell division protein FtsQ/DivIB [Lachnoclostridium phocaeense]|uniref:cell division protein FtsQ/DivIB n=1 Tax=Lachnoclostridium phocaeense TaxID=1871021 RepID=UPI00248F0B75|nr:hypothetical protein [Lachnoclostridium phocaeense]